MSNNNNSDFEYVKVQKRPKIEFSKKILIIASAIGLAIILFSCYLTYKMVVGDHDGNVTLIQTMLTGGFAEITAGTSFYYWKSKKENMIKLSKKYNQAVEGFEEADKNYDPEKRD